MPRAKKGLAEEAEKVRQFFAGFGEKPATAPPARASVTVKRVPTAQMRKLSTGVGGTAQRRHYNKPNSKRARKNTN